MDPGERQFLRARLDALVARVYGLTAPEFAYILTTFPLLDRDQPPLPLHRADIGRPSAECEPKSTLTRDLALTAFMLLSGWQPSPFGRTHPDFHRWLCEKLDIVPPAPARPDGSVTASPETPDLPADLAEWFAREVPEATIPEMGEIRDLEERLSVSLRSLGAIAYLPTRGGNGEEEEEPAEEEGEEDT